MDNLWQDVRFALRTLRKNPFVTILAVASLALAIAGNATVFSLVSSLVYRPLPYEEVERLVAFGERTFEDASSRAARISPANYFDVVERQSSFEQVAAFQPDYFSLDTGNDLPEQVIASKVTPGFFATLGAELAQGRSFAEAEGVEGRDRVVILSHGFWAERFGGQGDPSGETLVLNGESYEIVGVLAEDFEWLLNPLGKIWVPLAMTPDMGRQERFIFGLGRLKEGLETDNARAELEAIFAQLATEYPDSNRGYTAGLTNLRYDVPDTQTKLFMAILQGALIFVLLIACANVANLLLSRSQQREREIAIRSSVGAGRGRIVRQLLTESMVMAGLAGLLGVVLALGGIELLAKGFGSFLPAFWIPTLDTRTLLFGLGVTFFGGAIFGLAPVFQSLKADLLGALKDGTQAATAGGKKRLLANGLVVSEIALALAFLAGTGMMVRSFNELKAIDPGFDSENILLAFVRLPDARFPTEALPSATQQFREKLAAMPGVRGVAISTTTPRTVGLAEVTLEIDGRPTPADQAQPSVGWMVVGTEFFEVLGAPILQGRALELRDDLKASRVVVINEAMAERYWPGENALGQRITVEGESREIVGIVRNLKHNILSSRERGDVVYVPIAQLPSPQFVVAIRTAGEPDNLADAVRREIELFDRGVAIPQLRTLEAYLAQFLVGQRIFTSILIGFGTLALALAALGTYGVLAYSVTMRTHEIGVRIAIGASRKQVIGMIIRQGLMLGALGIALGFVFVFWVQKVVAASLQGIITIDVWQPVAAVSLVIALMTLLASFLPAQRAAGVDPITALRCE